MATKLKPVTFTITQIQMKWLKDMREKTGLKQVEIVRRALDDYAESEEAKEQRRFFTPQQRHNIREAARMKGVAEIEVIRTAIDRELRFMTKLQRTRKET